MKKAILFLVLGVALCLLAPGMVVQASEKENVNQQEETGEEFQIVDGVLEKYLGDATEVIIPDGVAVIGEDAFHWNKKITSVVIPDSVIELESAAFEGCSKLSEIRLSNGLKIIRLGTFFFCNNLEELVIPEGVKILIMPLGIKGLKKLTLPSTMIACDFMESELASLEEIRITGGGNEYLVKKLEEYHWEIQDDGTAQNAEELVLRPRSVTENPEIVNENEEFVIQDGVLLKYQGTASEVVIPQEVTVIGKKAFFSNDELVKVILSEKVECIEEQAFAYCGKLKEVQLSENVQQVGRYAFAYCYELKCINLSKVKKLEFAAFYQCSALKEVNLTSLEWLGDRVFSGTDELMEFAGLNKLPVMIGNGFAGSRYWKEYGAETGENSFWILDGVLLSGKACSGEVEIPETVHEIAANAFGSNNQITSVMIPKSVIKIGANAFGYCKNLKIVRMEDSVQELGEFVFTDCEKLSDIRLSNQLQILPKGAFYKCTGLKKITVPEQVIMIGSCCFEWCEKLKEIVIPNGIIEWDVDYEPKDASIYIAETSINTYMQDLIRRRSWEIEELRLEASVLVLNTGEKYPLRFVSGAKAMWKSSDKSVAYVGRTGNIYARKPGTAIITATIYGKEYTCRVTVE